MSTTAIESDYSAYPREVLAGQNQIGFVSAFGPWISGAD